MHERFFFPADVIAIVLAFYLPRYWYVPIVIGLISFFSYFPYLFNKIIIPLPWSAAVMLILIIILTRELLLIFRARSP